ncbi:hypothetical protein [Bradyrhizobium sp. OK095]|jgi:hypothetical protein|uniref:hypothetical protein n=1 Tax=Bradyrhizobium sp. OK095 TaxID=1882760 RepID=UPI00115FD0F3|nr:hypothetical protein [Bradyrhizobium sp. OK095]
MLASAFDYASDGVCFQHDAITTFKSLVQDTVPRDVGLQIIELIERKQQCRLKVQGLERGVSTLEIVLSHFGQHNRLLADGDVYDAGILCQIVDDVLDFEGDMDRGELNFMRGSNFCEHLSALVEWNYIDRFRRSAYPLALFRAIGKAQVKARKLLDSRDAFLRSST